jgi:glycosyltransferase involved in cell wall biosynthesis
MPELRRLAVVMSHASRTMGGALRELHFLAALRQQGVDARLWRMHPGPETEREEMLGIPLSFCTVDNPAEIPHRQVSTSLRAELAGFAPDLVLYKGLSYRVNADVQAALPAGTRYGFIVGGAVTDVLLPGAAVVFGEYPEQLARCFPDQLKAGRALVMPKYVDLARAGDGTPAEAPEFDIVNVGTFAEKRKNQPALLPFAARHRIAFVGGGPLLSESRRAARRAGTIDNITFFGRLPNPEVFGVLRRSRIMVHPSTGDGLPRATIEAMACGLPVIALRDTVAGGVPPEAGLLVSDAGLPHAVELLLADDGLRRKMGAAARAHVERNHGVAAIEATAARALDLLRAG